MIRALRILAIPAFFLMPHLHADEIGGIDDKSGKVEEAATSNSQPGLLDIWARELRSIGREGRNSDRAQAALRQTATAKASDIPALLDGFTDANPLARNLLRGAIESIADQSPQGLPLNELEARIKNPQTADPHARGLAFDLLQKQTPDRAAQLVPGLLQDPNPDLRRLAVAQAIERAANRATEGDQVAARNEYERALTGAIDRDQVTTIVEALKSMGREVNLPQHFGFITNWSMIGPFDNTGAKAFDVAYPPEKEWKPDAEYQGKSSMVRWRPIATEDDFGIVDLTKELEEPHGTVVYLTAIVESDVARTGELRLGTQNAWKLWLNGKFLFGHDEYHRGMIMDQHRLPIQLQPGENRVLFKLLQDEQTEDWAQSFNFQLRLTDTAGQALLNTSGVIKAEADSTPEQRPPSPKVPSAKPDKPLDPAELPPAPPAKPVSLIVSEWGQFRGPGATGEVADTKPPINWKKEDAPGWRSPLPGRGFSQPVVSGERVFTTCSSGFSKNRLHIVCHDLETGKRLWHRQFWATGRTSVPEDTRVATPTPVATKNHLYCLFSSGDLICLDQDGNLRWLRGLAYDYPEVTNNLGMASSPALAGDALVCQMEADTAAYAIGLNPSTGMNLWKIDRPRKANWTSPISGPAKNKLSLLLEGGGGVESIDPSNGKRHWLQELSASTVSSMTRAGQTLMVPANGLTALQLSTDAETPETLWNNRQLSCSFVSPVIADKLVLIINSAGVLRAADIATGKMAWQLRLGGNFWGTPTAADGRLYCPDREGRLVIVKITEKSGEILAEHEIGEPLYSPPVLVKNSIVLRTDTQLIRIGPL